MICFTALALTELATRDVKHLFKNTTAKYYPSGTVVKTGGR